MSEKIERDESGEFVEALLRETLGSRPRPTVPVGFSGHVMKRLEAESTFRRPAALFLAAYWILAGVATFVILARLPWGEWPPWIWMAAIPAGLLVLTRPLRAISAVARFLQALFA